jgi:hypothetical protein
MAEQDTATRIRGLGYELAQIMAMLRYFGGEANTEAAAGLDDALDDIDRAVRALEGDQLVAAEIDRLVASS